MYEKINDLKAEFTRRSMSEDEAELQAVRDRFAKLADEVRKFNENSKNRIKVSGEGLDELRDKVIADLTAKQEKLKRDAVLAEVMTTEEQILGIRDKYAQKYLALGKAATTYQIQELARLRDAEIEEAKDAAFQKTEVYKQLSEDIAFYAAEQMKVQIQSLEEFLKAAEGISPELKKKLEADLTVLKAKSGRSSEDNYTADLSKQKELLLSNLKTLKAGTSEYQKQLDKLNQINGELSNGTSVKYRKTAADLKEVSGMAGELSRSFNGVDESISKMLETAGKLADIGSNAMSALASFASGPSGIIAGITQALSAVGGFISLFGKGRQEMQEYYQKVAAGEQEYARMMRERERIQKNITDLTIQELEARKDMLSGQGRDVQKEFDDLLEKLQNEGAGAAERLKDKSFRKNATPKIIRSVENVALLKNADYASIEKLFTEGRINTGPVGELVKQLIKAKEELDALKESGEETEDVLTRIRTGTTINDLQSALFDMFKNGKTEAADFAEFFETTMQDAIFSTFKNDTLNRLIADWYKEFDELSKDGLSDTDVSKLQSDFQKDVIEAGNKKLEKLKKLSGLDFTGKAETADKNTLSGAIKGITADQADLLAGQFGGLRLAQLETNSILKPMGMSIREQRDILQANLNVALRIEANTGRTADNTEHLKRLERVETALINIDRNITSSNGVIAANGGRI